MKRYTNKVCLVTASTAGIGLAIAKRMAEEGAQVIICSRKQANVDTAVGIIAKNGGKVEGVVADVGIVEHRQKLVKLIADKYGKLDVLVPNAAVSTHFGSQFEITEKAYDKLWAVNVKSTFFLIKECLPHLR